MNGYLADDSAEDADDWIGPSSGAGERIVDWLERLDAELPSDTDGANCGAGAAIGADNGIGCENPPACWAYCFTNETIPQQREISVKWIH